ncbi:MAG: hypothetical protein Q7R30_23885 [Acidobacteriota bacterium]|nr:hypothetical protein [Acidobacteriota bacterium]
MSDYFNRARQGLVKANSVLGSTAAVVRRPSTVGEFVSGLNLEARPDVTTNELTPLVGAAAGAYLWNEHRVLGALGGYSLARNAPALLRPNERRFAMCNMGVTGAGIAGSLVFKNYPTVGFLIGWAGASLAVHIGKLR